MPLRESRPPFPFVKQAVGARLSLQLSLPVLSATMFLHSSHGKVNWHRTENVAFKQEKSDCYICSQNLHCHEEQD